MKKIIKNLNIPKIKMLENIIKKIANSTKDHLGKESSTRINIYVLLSLVVFISVYCVVKNTLNYEVLGLISLLLGQLSILLNVKKNAEKTPFPSLDELNKLKDKKDKK